MSRLTFASVTVAAVIVVAAPATAQTNAQLEANKKIALAFLRAGATPMERYQLLHDGFVDHGTQARRRAEESKVSAKEDFLKTLEANAPGRRGGAGPMPPASQAAPITIAEGDIVTVIRERNLQDPTEAPGAWYTLYLVDVFRITDGKIVVRWRTHAEGV